MSNVGIKGAIGGLLVVNKPRGITSRAAVDRVVRLVGRRVKVGHAGTLDPLASGVLVVCVGPATRLVEDVQSLPKSYRTVVRLGARSDTLDADGRIEPEPDPRVPTPDEVAAAVAPMVGEIDQLPPDYSALKVGGRRAYELVRAGQAVALAPRRVRIDRIGIVGYEWPHLELEVDCGSGTYIRSIARDVGEALRCGGLVDVLVRTRIGPFTLEDAAELDGISAASLPESLRPMAEAVAGLPRLVLDAGRVADVGAGRSLPVGPGTTADLAAGPIALLDAHGRLVAVAEFDPVAEQIRPRKVFVGQSVTA
jgi:tRNA pseudouridine55 synthase